MRKRGKRRKRRKKQKREILTRKIKEPEGQPIIFHGPVLPFDCDNHFQIQEAEAKCLTKSTVRVSV